MNKKIYPCEVCGEPVPGWEPTFCCNAFDCGCQGRSVEPCVCSAECWEKLMNPPPQIENMRS